MPSQFALTSAPGCGNPQHQCNPKTLRAIDNAMQADEYQERTIPMRARLALGFAMMGDFYVV